LIVRSFYNKTLRRYAHLVICSETDVAAIIDPVSEDADAYAGTASKSGARIGLALQTAAHPADPTGLRTMIERFGVTAKAPAASHVVHADGIEPVAVGEALKIGALEVDVVANTPPAGPDVAYRVEDTLFTGWALVRGGVARADGPVDAEDLVVRARQDLGALLDAGKLTAKEAELAQIHLALLDRLGRPPSAQELAAEHPALDRGAVHVLIHGMRRKQIALGQVPILLHGQMHKWLKGLQGEPEYTAHERTFLAEYLRFVGETGRVPSGPELLERLPEGTTIQWVRKRIHTIRRKQAAFGRTPLQIGREPRRSD
jgi:hypothetical protein